MSLERNKAAWIWELDTMGSYSSSAAYQLFDLSFSGVVSPDQNRRPVIEHEAVGQKSIHVPGI